jgi:hypothetical protein
MGEEGWSERGWSDGWAIKEGGQASGVTLPLRLRFVAGAPVSSEAS